MYYAFAAKVAIRVRRHPDLPARLWVKAIDQMMHGHWYATVPRT